MSEVLEGNYEGYRITSDDDNYYIYRADSVKPVKVYEIDDSPKNMWRLCHYWIEQDIVDRKPAPPISELVWIPVTERYPDDSRQVIIREGNNIAMAHWFASSQRPVGKDEWVDNGPMWANQHYILHGSRIDNPTHWMDVDKLLAIPYEPPHVEEKAEIDVPMYKHTVRFERYHSELRMSETKWVDIIFPQVTDYNAEEFDVLVWQELWKQPDTKAKPKYSSWINVEHTWSKK